jgi:hypothetical protein
MIGAVAQSVSIGSTNIGIPGVGANDRSLGLLGTALNGDKTA